MSVRSALALLLVLSLSLLTPASASELAGVVRTGSTEAPLAGVRVWAGDPATGAVYPSEPTGADGAFSIRDLPAATYQLAVEASGGLHLVERPLPLAEGQEQLVGIALAPAASVAPGGSAGLEGGGLSVGRMNAQGNTSVWNNPLTAALIVVGLAVVFGLLIESATDDEDAASPTDSGS